MGKEYLQRIKGFIASQRVFTLATCGPDGPWCAPCFYAFDPDGMRLVFMSAPHTRHIMDLAADGRVAGSILPDRTVIGRLRGIQFTGTVLPCDRTADPAMLQRFYVQRFPMARAMAGDCHVLTLNTVKMTDNTLGFGSKLHWERTDHHHALN